MARQHQKQEKYEITKALKVLGVRLKGKKICKADFQKIFGGTYREPEWVLMMDYKIKTPFDYVKIVEKEETKLGRAMLPSSYSITRFGRFLNAQGEEVVLDGLIYQYSLAKNPRNVHYAYRLFLDGSTVTKNSGLSGIQSAKQECSEQAKQVIEKELYDLA